MKASRKGVISLNAWWLYSDSGDGQSGNKSPKCQRQPHKSGQPGGAETYEYNGQNEQFATSGADDLLEYPGNQEARPVMGRKNHGSGLGAYDHYSPDAVAATGQQRGKQHQRHDAQILEYEDTHGHLAVRGICLPGIDKQFHKNRGAGERNQKTDKKSLPAGKTETGTNGCYSQDGNNHLADRHPTTPSV